MIAQETDWLRQSNCEIIERRERKILLPFFLPELATVLELSWPRKLQQKKSPPSLASQSFLTTPHSFAPSRSVSLSLTAPGGLFFPRLLPRSPHIRPPGLCLSFSPFWGFYPRRILWTLNFTVNSSCLHPTRLAFIRLTASAPSPHTRFRGDPLLQRSPCSPTDARGSRAWWTAYVFHRLSAGCCALWSVC